ncbi:thiol-activated cytolysin family protein [Pedobacter sp. MR2016-19]|uniref:thiol-activated cytolysin family protein n=1 Tax=Pedobacter sp. MR2016-19 TaxID=2780089 RepID=UPI001875FC79|nr:thiol-activated cytolysin family protein [Pedobacter sp. MR2016-19]MBE5320113.1 thiol-activated cytolysin family protein [Pedobacter sp. MR2016-19]
MMNKQEAIWLCQAASLLFNPNLKYMYNNKFILLLSLAICLLSCKKDIDRAETLTENTQLKKGLPLSSVYGNLKIEPLSMITIEGGRNKELKDFLDRAKQNTTTFLRDSSWTDGFSKIYQSDEMVVTPDNESYVYPGSIIKSASVASGNFSPLKGYVKLPIDILASFPSDKAAGKIDTPSLSKTRVFLRNALMDPFFSGRQLEDFSYTSSFFNSYEESKLSFGYNLNEKRLFSSVNSSFNSANSRTSYSTGLILTYLVKNFTLAMPSDPVTGQLIDYTRTPSSVYEGVSPVYINSVTYGRFGFLMIETNSNSAATKTAFEKVVKKIFKKTTETFTFEEESIFNSSRLTVYLMGSNGGAVTQLINNPGSYDGLSNFISESLGEFTANDPGVPVQFTLKYLKDNSPYRPIFKVDYYY